MQKGIFLHTMGFIIICKPGVWCIYSRLQLCNGQLWQLAAAGRNCQGGIAKDWQGGRDAPPRHFLHSLMVWRNNCLQHAPVCPPFTNSVWAEAWMVSCFRDAGQPSANLTGTHWDTDQPRTKTDRTLWPNIDIKLFCTLLLCLHFIWNKCDSKHTWRYLGTLWLLFVFRIDAWLLGPGPCLRDGVWMDATIVYNSVCLVAFQQRI